MYTGLKVMATTLSAKRLRKELIALQRDPVENITARPLESNILVWHYVLKGAKGSPYEGGYYHGKLKFPPEYPLKPPSIMMLTPSGRFKPNTRLCLSMSDFHPETWNPMWSVSTILMGLQAFMLDSAPTLGSIETSLGQKKKLAASSMAFNLTSPLFVQMFPEIRCMRLVRVSGLGQPGKVSRVQMVEECRGRDLEKTEG
ncbi:ubiquitin-conjugating enzyme e2 j2 isoform 2 [Nannochloropsis gaditana]|uniref:E2 ubiquitin-conjugating enzyme n=1 Tax=Nannochloropsis gaditana TaxID=72520 RepID=W7TL51_9STRA|nr:ubiquitin-conjugating enzyme e2 j2 isoform 2 [Nannochloropsis gaditana]